MAFRRKSNEHEQWLKYCSERSQYLDALPRLALLLHSPDHFDSFLQSGAFNSKNGPELAIETLTDREWDAFVAFVNEYSDTWQSYFTRTQYIAFFNELDRRTRQSEQRS